MSDHLGTIAGVVTDPDRARRAGVVVLLFPADPAFWNESSPVLLQRRLQRRWLQASRQPTASYAFDMPPDGDYRLVAVDEQAVRQLRGRAVYEHLSALGELVHARQGTTITMNLTVKQ